jgi:hypothetical protein
MSSAQFLGNVPKNSGHSDEWSVSASDDENAAFSGQLFFRFLSPRPLLHLPAGAS